MRKEILKINPIKRKHIKITLFDNGDVLWIEGRKFKQDMKSIGDILRLRNGVRDEIGKPLFKKTEEGRKTDKILLELLDKSIQIKINTTSYD